MAIKSDIIVLGVGGMGSAACYHLAKRGVNVIGIEQFKIAHDRGSSHGETRAIRQAYFENPNYVPLLKRAYELWDDLCRETKRGLFHKVGMLICGPSRKSNLLPGVLDSAKKFYIPIHSLTHGDIKSEYPHFTLPEDFQGVFEPNAGFLEVENCVKSHVEIAKKCGARIKAGEIVREWTSNSQGVTVKTDKHIYVAQKLVITAGAWSNRVLHELKTPLTVHRNVQLWYGFDKKIVHANKTPCFCFEMPYGIFYGFPPTERYGLKVAEHAPGEIVTDVDHVARELKISDRMNVERCLKETLPWAGGSVTRHAVCFYTMTPDTNFVIDLHPQYPNVHFAAGFSGHGFKFAAVIGEVLADLSLAGQTSHPVEFLRLR